MKEGGADETERREEEGKHQRSAARVVEEAVAEKPVLRGRCFLGTESDLASSFNIGSCANKLKMVSEHSRALRTIWHKPASRRNSIVWRQ